MAAASVISRACRPLLLGSLLFACGAAQSQAFDAGERGKLPLEELRTFADVFNQIRAGYVEEIEDSQLLEYAIEGMLMGLDPHSVYLTRDAFSDLQSTTSGEFSGLGIEVGMEDGFLKIIAPIDGSPAAEAGLLPGDVILKLGSSPVKGMSLSRAVDRMRGPKGREIELTIGRSGTQPFSVTLVRDTIKVASVRERWLEPGFGYIRISQFQQSTGEDTAAALARLQASPDLKGVVLDLRNNPGGVLGASVDVADLFLAGGIVVYTEGRLANAARTYSAGSDDPSSDIPLVVLINGGSASASEIVAGALQDHGRAIIMGTRSFGKGSVQTVLPISEDRAVKLTTARYFTPNGRSIQAEGIEPDVLVERARLTAVDESARITEADLEGHLSGGDETAADRIPESAGLLGRDNQLYEALNLLKGIHILGLRRPPAPVEARAGDAPAP